jgi:hypothetical protein
MRKRAFKLLIKRGSMNVWTLHLQPAYEAAFCAYTAAHATHRIRAVMAIGAVFVALKMILEFVVLEPLSERSPAHQVRLPIADRIEHAIDSCCLHAVVSGNSRAVCIRRTAGDGHLLRLHICPTPGPVLRVVRLHPVRACDRGVDDAEAR